MKRTHLRRRGAVIFFLIFIFADLLPTKVCCEEILGLPDTNIGGLTACAADMAVTSFAVARCVDGGVCVAATDPQQGPASKAIPPCDNCFCCGLNVVPSTSRIDVVFGMKLLSPDLRAIFLLSPPPQSPFHPPRLV